MSYPMITNELRNEMLLEVMQAQFCIKEVNRLAEETPLDGVTRDDLDLVNEGLANLIIDLDDDC